MAASDYVLVQTQVQGDSYYFALLRGQERLLTLQLDVVDEGKLLYVGDITSDIADSSATQQELQAAGHLYKAESRNTIGPFLIRQLIRKLAEKFPSAEAISGNRMSGAREAASNLKFGGFGGSDTYVPIPRSLRNRSAQAIQAPVASEYDIGFADGQANRSPSIYTTEGLRGWEAGRDVYFNTLNEVLKADQEVQLMFD